METNQAKNVITTILSSNANLVRFVLLLLFFFLFLGTSVWLIIKTLNKEKTGLNVSFTENGATVILSPSGDKKALFLLPASAPWINTQIKIEENSELKFHKSGLVNLGISNLVKSAEADTKPLAKWTGPIGYNVSLQPKDRMRTSMLINPKGKLGTVVGYIQTEGESAPGISNPRPNPIFEVNKTYTSKSKGYLWLCVNDFLMTPSDRDKSMQAFVGDTSGKDRAKRIKMFSMIESQSYWNLWFDDNIGEYLIQIEIKK